MKKILATVLMFALILQSKVTFCQTINSSFVGTYEDRLGDIKITALTLFVDGTFELDTPDPVFSYTYKNYKTRGRWISEKNKVILNPDKQPRKPKVNIIEERVTNTDSITLKINYKIKEYEKEQLISEHPLEFELFTVFINNKKNYYHLVRSPQIKHCLFAPRVKNQILVDSTNIMRIPKTGLTKIGIFTYGFDNHVELNVSNPNSDFFEIEIIQPVDIERTPRNKKVLIQGNKAFFYERNGEVDKSLSQLTKRR